MNVSLTQAAVGEDLSPAIKSSDATTAAETGAVLSGVGTKPPFPAPAAIPTQEGPLGIQFDFNSGCRATFPEGEHPWRVRLSDLDTGNVVFETNFKGGAINSTKRYYIRFRLDVWQQDTLVFSHEYSAKERDILIQLPVGTLGDTMGWFPYAVKFWEKHGCRLTCAMGEKLIPLFQKAYPEIEFVNHEAVKGERFYATYSVGLFFDDKDCVFQPCDFRYVGLHRTAGYILGVDPTEVPPKLAYLDESRPIQEPYVCIAAQSTSQAKYWNNPEGWRSIVAFLKETGYRVICIDQKPTHGTGVVWNHIPYGAEDETGDHPLQERARWLRHCDFFVGLSSGLSWLAWAAGCPVVMISGFSHPLNEFATPYRVINYHTCNSCWNDPKERFDHKDFLWCPRHANTPRQFECTRLITVDHVKAVIRKVPQFASRETDRPVSRKRAHVQS
jgi:autotransporter strand-loop-strand O-heptosyltransferase